MITSALCNVLAQTILSESILRIAPHKTSKERCRLHTPYAETDVLQTFCIESALRLEVAKAA